MLIGLKLLLASLCPSVRLSAYISVTTTGRVFVNFDIGVFYDSLSKTPINLVKVG
jgi:hypothetical protein